MSSRLLMGALVMATSAQSIASPLDFSIRSVTPVPTSLRMRAPTSEDATPVEKADEAPTIEQRQKTLSESSRLERKLAEAVVFRLNLGFGFDAGIPSGEPLTSGQSLETLRSFDALRSYGFGDVVLGSQGLLSSSLSSYFAAQFRFDQSSTSSYAVPTVYDGRNVREILARSAYGELRELGTSALVRPLRIRAGRQFRYGAAIAHFDGLTAAYETAAIQLSLYGGRRVSHYGFDLAGAIGNEGGIAGGSIRLALHELIGVPLVVSADGLSFDDLGYLDTKLAYRISRRSSVIARTRFFDSKVGRLALLLRTRLSKVATISAALTRRTRNDFVYDILLPRPVDGDATDARRYLAFGDVRPRTLFNLRAGTVLLRNIDVLFRGAFAIDGSDEETQQESTYYASYGELGGALEVRLRRSLRIGASVLGRKYSREEDVDTNAMLRDGVPGELLADTGSLGETDFAEGGLSLRYSTGARKFTATAEVYSRSYWFRTPYIEGFENDSDNRSGGRFSVEGWAGSRIRVRAEYDVARLPEVLAPEFRRAQSLRVLTEGRF